MSRIKELIEKHGIMKYPNVIGYSEVLQNRIRGGKEVPVKVIRIYVSKKLPKAMLKSEEIIPEKLEEFETDVVEIGKIKKLDVYTGRYRPSPAGVSTSRADQMAAGTIGWFLIDSQGTIYMISNNHVWANENKAQKGDPLVQPGVLDGGIPLVDVIGTLNSFIPIDFSQNAQNYVDLAIADIVDMSKIYTTIIDFGGVCGKEDATQGSTVTKVGRTTGITSGQVTDTAATIQVEYDSGTATFSDLYVVQSDNVICLPGDSGSPIISQDKKFGGLLFAGDETGKVLIGFKQSRIESEIKQKLGMDLKILTVNCPSTSQNPDWCKKKYELPFGFTLCWSGKI